MLINHHPQITTLLQLPMTNLLGLFNLDSQPHSLTSEMLHNLGLQSWVLSSDGELTCQDKSLLTFKAVCLLGFVSAIMAKKKQGDTTLFHKSRSPFKMLGLVDWPNIHFLNTKFVLGTTEDISKTEVSMGDSQLSSSSFESSPSGDAYETQLTVGHQGLFCQMLTS